MPSQSLAPIPIFNTQTARAVLIILSCVSAYFTYKGASMALAAGLVTWLTKMDAVLFAIGSSTVLYFL
ncbi:MAG: hypothetical protein QNJ84_02240 [Alphaproteobacteria bacterium]|nr:hypothetical protein [Alphaproteobacteria bacterium]